jgi:hypothetical protein
VHRHQEYGLSPSSACWVAEDHLRRALTQLEHLVDAYIAGARTWAGRAWRRRKTRAVLESVHEALWFTAYIQQWPPRELICPPALFYRNRRPAVLDQAMLLLGEEKRVAV